MSADGVRQDLIVAEPPVGVGDLRVELALFGAQAEAVPGGVRLTFERSGRVLTYSRLRVEDATGRLAVRVAEANAAYPVRIDPTFTDAQWVRLGSGINGTARSNPASTPLKSM